MPDDIATYVLSRDLPAVIRRLREAQGLTHAALARDLDVDESAIAAAEGQAGWSKTGLRRRLLERLTGQEIVGPFYRIAEIAD